MGVQVAVLLDSQLKPNYTVSTVLAPAFVVAAGACVVWIGNAHLGGKHFEVTGIRKCLQALRESGSTTPESGNHSFAKVAAPGFTKDVSKGFNVTDLTLLTGTVTVTIGTKAVVGVGTTFLTDYVAGGVIRIAGEYHTIDAITTDLALTIVANHAAGAAAADHYKVALTALLGTMSVTAGTPNVVGVGTDFVTELVAGTSVLLLEGEYIVVTTITDLENIILASNHVGGAAAKTGQLATPTLLTGTVSVSAGTKAVTGVGTTFLADLSVGDVIKIGSQLLTIATITSSTALALAANHTAGASGVAFSVSNTPAELDVGIWYGDLFQPLSGSTLTPHVLRALEKYLESTQKSA